MFNINKAQFTNIQSSFKQSNLKSSSFNINKGTCKTRWQFDPHYLTFLSMV